MKNLEKIRDRYDELFIAMQIALDEGTEEEYRKADEAFLSYQKEHKLVDCPVPIYQTPLVYEEAPE